MNKDPIKNLDGMTFGERLNWLRLKFDLTRRQMARYLGVSVSAVGYWELGKDLPTVYKVFAIADMLGVDARCLAEGFPASHPLRHANGEINKFDDVDVSSITKGKPHADIELSGNIVKPKKRYKPTGEINVRQSRGNQPGGVAQKQSRRSKQNTKHRK